MAPAAFTCSPLSKGGVSQRIRAPTACEAVSRRHLVVDTAAGALLASVVQPSRSMAAAAPPVEEPARALTLQDVTPPIAPAGPLPAAEQAMIDVFERSTYSVVNIFDISLQGASVQATADVPEGNGSGFIYDHKGHIVTNYHVLGNILKGIGASPNQRPAAGVKVARVTVLGKDGVKHEYFATLAGAFRPKDLVVLKINADPKDLQPATLGNSSEVKVGQQCLAIGSPFGFDHSLTTGAVSGLNRVIQSQVGTVIAGGIQTDAAINPGNSGGPLLDSRGRVIGVNTAIFTNSGISAGVGFAIPIDTIKKIVPQLIDHGKVVTPTLGVTFASAQVSRALKVPQGALIQSVDASSPAGKAGLLGTRRGVSGIVPGDVLVAMNGKTIEYAQDADVVLEQLSVGDVVTLRVRRGIEQAWQTCYIGQGTLRYI